MSILRRTDRALGAALCCVVSLTWLVTCEAGSKDQVASAESQLTRRPPEPPEPPDPDAAAAAACFAATSVRSFTVTPGPRQLRYGEAFRLSWDVSPGCPELTTNTGSLLGSRDFAGRNDPFAFVLTGTVLGYSKTLAQVIVSRLALPCPTNPSGHPSCAVTITRDDQQRLLADALARPDTRVDIAPTVNMDLTTTPLVVASDVQLFGGGGVVSVPGGGTKSLPGALLYTTGYPHDFLLAQDVNNVRITGLRIRGASQEPNDNGPTAFGVVVFRGVNVEIDHNEIFGWNNAAVRVDDEFSPEWPDRINRQNGVGAVRVHHNVIHHNQLTSQGYGVVVTQGAYALVEKNVFDFNRHAMAGDSIPPTSGYFFYRNLVLEHGGVHDIGPFSVHTHIIDMHGTETCNGIPAYCGLAGEYMDIAGNTVLYKAGTAVKIRGFPTDRVDVTGNVFTHSQVWAGAISDGALESTVDGGRDLIHESGNTFGLNPIPRVTYAAGGQTVEGPRLRTPDVVRFCDFDGDGVAEEFYATGTSWWVKRAGDPDYVMRHLNTSVLRLSELATGDVNGDGICDVTSLVDGRVFLGGTQPVTHQVRADLLWRDSTSGALSMWLVNGGAISAFTTVAVPTTRTVLGAGDFDGDGDQDVLTTYTQGSKQRTVVSFLQDGLVVDEGTLLPVDPAARLAAIADFDGDGKADVLWRTSTGGLDLWQREDTAIAAHVSRNNQGVAMGPEWQVAGTGDFNADGYADLVWRETTGQMVVWFMVGSVYTGEFSLGIFPASRVLAGIGDFDADGFADLLWRDTTTGALTVWFKASPAGAAHPTFRNLGTPPDLALSLKAVSDFDGNGRADLLWQDAQGHNTLWFLDRGLFLRDAALPAFPGGGQLLGVLPELSLGR